MDVLDFDTHKPGPDGRGPVLSVIDESDAPEPTSLHDVTNPTKQKPLPSITVSKPPAPLPVELPTADDIIPPIPRESSYDEDLEAGHGIGMREVDHHRQDSALVSSRRAHKRNHIAGSSDHSPASIPLPSSPINSPMELTPLTSPVDLPPVQQVHDFFSDSGPPLAMTLIEPTSPHSPDPPDILSVEQRTAVAGTPPISAHTSQPVVDDVDAEDDASKPDANATIRLVGGGGIAGNVDAISFPPENNQVDGETEPDLADVASIASATSTASVGATTKDGKKHEKKKSGLSGIKLLGHLGGLRKRDSRGSVKDAT